MNESTPIAIYLQLISSSEKKSASFLNFFFLLLIFFLVWFVGKRGFFGWEGLIFPDLNTLCRRSKPGEQRKEGEDQCQTLDRVPTWVGHGQPSLKHRLTFL